jgi:hypothetical protein
VRIFGFDEFCHLFHDCRLTIRRFGLYGVL